MKKKWTALLLALVLSLSLLPTAALAEETTPTTGVYFAQQDGTPTGDCKTASERSNGSVTLTGYWDIPYTEGDGLTVYYYNAEMTELSGREHQPVTTAKVDKAGHLWSVTLSSSASEDEEWADLSYRTADGEGNFVMTFLKRVPVPSKPERGLYFRRLEEGPNTPLHENEEAGYIPLNSIDLAPFVDRMSMALYYHDGEDDSDYTPVNRVRLPFGSGFDMMWVKERVEGAKNHWYYLSAYDFSESKLYYYTGENYNAFNAEPAGFIDLNSHQLPPVAFYADDADGPSEGAYRMYTIMDRTPNSDAQHQSYQYTTTLCVRSTNEEFQFSGSGNTVRCFQKQYDERGYENGEQPYDDFSADIACGNDGKTLAVTIYANDTDLLLWLYGPEGEDQYAAYVNLLAPESSRLFLNDMGFAAAKYLPRHLFREALKKEFGITLSAGDYAADITCNKELTADIAGSAGSVTLEVNSGELTQEQKEAVAAASANVDFVGAVDITLAYGGETQHTFADGAFATISYPCELDLTGGKAVQVYYVYTEDGEQKTERLSGVYDAKNHCVTFTTTHFSTFVITAPKVVEVPATPSSGSSEPAYSVKLEAEGIQSDCRTAREGRLVTLTVRDGYDITGILVTDQNGESVEVTYQNGQYTFRMPGGPITVTPLYDSRQPVFSDVPEDYWALAAIRWAAAQGYMTGVSADCFAPAGTLSRQQMWMILARLSGAAPADMAAARAWAIANGVSDGTAPGTAVTRQQLVTFLYRYAVLMGYDVSGGEDTNILSYADVFSVSEYAMAAFQWACGAGYVNGTGTDTLSPRGQATRAQFVVILSRFCGVAA